MQEIKDKLIVALDVESLEKTESLVNKLFPLVTIFKVGSQLFTACGPEVVRMIGEKGAKVFLDSKFYDIPNTVSQAVASGTGLSCTIQEIAAGGAKDTISFPIFMMTVHIKDNKEMLEKAIQGAERKADELKIKRPFIVGVTVLTSDKNKQDTQDVVLKAARFAKAVGLDGVVCSAYEASVIRKELGKNFLIVTPGIRPKGYPSNDQARVTTPKEAIAVGADYIVVGRPIIESKDPRKVAEEILADMK